MTLLNTVPSWLRYFRLIVKNETDTILFDSWQDDHHLFKFVDQRGGVVGSEVKLQNKSNEIFKNYKIKTFQIYSDMTSHPSDLDKEKYGWQIDIVV